MKRRSFFNKLGISGLVASVAPQIIQEVKAEPEPFEIDEGVKVEYKIIPKDAVVKDHSIIFKVYIDGEEIKCQTTPYASVGKTFTAKGNKITLK